MVQHLLNDDMVFMTLTGIRDIDNYTFLHSVDVCIYSVVTAKALGMNYDEIQELALAAILHDVGKCKIPLSILNKPDKLTYEEFEMMKRHTLYGLEIVNRLPGLNQKIGRIICQHHERCFLYACFFSQDFCFVSAFPCKIRVISAKMPICRCLFVDRSF